MLQTLCRRCNGDKAAHPWNFRRSQTTVVAAHADFGERLRPSNKGDRAEWERCMRATLNHYYRCAAVSQVEIGGRGPRFYEWRIVLSPGNDPRLLEPHLPKYLAWIRDVRSGGGYNGPDAVLLEGSDATHRAWGTRVAAAGGARSFPR